jgi:hypothetical protein
MLSVSKMKNIKLTMLVATKPRNGIKRWVLILLLEVRPRPRPRPRLVEERDAILTNDRRMQRSAKDNLLYHYNEGNTNIVFDY